MTFTKQHAAENRELYRVAKDALEKAREIIREANQ